MSSTIERREYKYLIDEATAESIRLHMRGICELDKYAAQTRGRYLIDTLYLDTDELHSYRATVEDADDRYKLRIRRYASLAGSPVFLEVKRRVGDAIVKTRGAFGGDWVRLLEETDPEILAEVPASQRRAVDNFICKYRLAPMRPAVLVRYEREPYASVIDDYARITFDRSLCYFPMTDLALVPGHEQGSYIDYASSQRGLAHAASSVLLELKFTNVVPSWMRRMVRALDIQRLAFCKYTRAIDAHRLVPARRTARFQ